MATGAHGPHAASCSCLGNSRACIHGKTGMRGGQDPGTPTPSAAAQAQPRQKHTQPACRVSEAAFAQQEENRQNRLPDDTSTRAHASMHGAKSGAGHAEPQSTIVRVAAVVYKQNTHWTTPGKARHTLCAAPAGCSLSQPSDGSQHVAIATSPTKHPEPQPHCRHPCAAHPPTGQP